MNEVLKAIYARRSVRHFTGEQVSDEDIKECIKAASWAPSGLNNQPWRFVVIRDAGVRQRLSMMTKYSAIIQSSDVCVAVFVDRDAMYHEAKDHQAMGACIQNMLLAAHSLGLGAVWLGEILKQADAVHGLLETGDNLELMAVVAIGHPEPTNRTSNRKDIGEVIVKEI